MRALTAGKRSSARTAALAKNDMKPRRTPCRRSKPSLCRARSAITGCMSISLKVVRIAAVRCASTRRSAIRRRSLDIGSRRSPREPGAGSAGAGAGADVLGFGADAGGRYRAGGERRSAGRRLRCDAGGGRCWCGAGSGGWRYARGRFRGGFEMGEHVALGEPAVSPGARDLRRVEAMLVDEPAHRGAQALAAGRSGPGIRRGGGSGGGVFGPRCAGGRSPGIRRDNGGRDKSGGRIRSRGGCASAGIDPGEHFLAQHRIAGLLQHLGQESCRGRRNLKHDLVGFKLDQDLVLFDPIAGLLTPFKQRGVRDGLGQHRHLHIDGHCGVSSDADDSRNVHDYRMVRGGRRPAFPRFTHAHALFLREAA